MAALALTNALMGLAGIGAGVGFGLAEQSKMDELNGKSKKLQESVAKASDLYDHVYYLVSVNVSRYRKALDKIPTDFLQQVEKQIKSDIAEDDYQKAIQSVNKYLGYIGQGIGVATGIVDVVRALRNRRASGEEPEEPSQEPFEDVPVEPSETPAPPVESESSLPKSSKLDSLSKGLNIAGVVFGVAGLAATIGLGAWTLEKLNNAISDVEKKQEQVDQFHKAMENALDPIVTAAGLPAKSYQDLLKMADTWKKISENFESYQTSFYFAIRGYFMKKPLADIKSLVSEHSDKGMPFPDDGYALAKTLADDVQREFKEKKSDKEIVAFFATENPKKGLRFVFNEFFISSLHF